MTKPITMELKPCPFCGGEPIKDSCDELKKAGVYTRCWCPNQECAIYGYVCSPELWNTRTAKHESNAPVRDDMVEEFIEEHMMECRDITDEVFVEAIDVEDVRKFLRQYPQPRVMSVDEIKDIKIKVSIEKCKYCGKLSVLQDDFGECRGRCPGNFHTIVDTHEINMSQSLAQALHVKLHAPKVGEK